MAINAKNKKAGTVKHAKNGSEAKLVAREKKKLLVVKKIQALLPPRRLAKTDVMYMVTQKDHVHISVWKFTAIRSSQFRVKGRPPVMWSKNRFYLQKVWMYGEGEFGVGYCEFPIRGSIAYFARGKGIVILQENPNDGVLEEVFHTSPIKGYFYEEGSAIDFAESLPFSGRDSVGEVNRDTKLWSFWQHHQQIVLPSMREFKRRGQLTRLVA